MSAVLSERPIGQPDMHESHYYDWLMLQARLLREGRIKEAEGSKQAAILTAEGGAAAVKLQAGGKAEATKVNAAADSEAIQKVGAAEAEIILAKGTSTAEAYKLEVAAMGREVFGQIRVIDKIAASNLKFIPDNLVMGGGAGEGSNLVNGLFGIALLEKLSGRSFTPVQTDLPKP